MIKNNFSYNVDINDNNFFKNNLDIKHVNENVNTS